MSEAIAHDAPLAALLAALPIVDEHCHAPLRPPAPADLDAFLALFTESREAEIVRTHVPHTLYFQRALQDLAALYGCAPEPAAVLARRQALSPAALLQQCTTRARLVALLVDTGYRDEESYTVDELNGLLPAGCRAWPLLRLERLLERLIAQSASFAALEEAFMATLADLRRQGYVALKSIRAYRCGLALDPPDRQAAAEVFPALRRAAQAGALRLTAKPLLDYFFWQACAAVSAPACTQLAASSASAPRMARAASQIASASPAASDPYSTLLAGASSRASPTTRAAAGPTRGTVRLRSRYTPG